MATDIRYLLNKRDGLGDDNENGMLFATDFVKLVTAVQENQEAVKGVVKGIKFGLGAEVTNPNDKGIVTINTDVTDTYKFSFLSPDEKYEDVLQYVNSFPSYILAGQSYNVKVRISFKERFNDVDTSVKTPLKVNFKVGTNTVYTTNIYDFYLQDNLIKDSEKTISFNFANYLTNNSINDCSIEVFDPAEYPRITPKPLPLNRVFVVNASCNIKLEGTENNLNIYDSDSLDNESSNIVITTSSSSGKVRLFCKEYSTETPVFTVDNINSEITRIRINNTNLNNIIRTHGTHTLYAKFEYPIPGTNDKLNVDSNELSYIFYDNTIGSEDPLVSINKVSSDLVFKEYNQVMLSYLIYLPENYISSETKEERSIKIETNKYGDSAVIISRSYEIVPEQLTTKILTGNILYLLSNTVDKTAQLDSGKYEMTISFENYSSKMDIEIERADINLEEFNITTDLRVYFKSADKSPGDTTWSYTYEDTINNSAKTYDVEFKNFDFTEYGSSFKTDTSLDGGQTVLTIKRNSSIVIPYPIFAKPLELEVSENGSQGKTISIEFKTYNCVSQVKPIITCMDMNVKEKDRVGFIVYPNKIIVQSKSGSKFEAKFKEDEQIKLDIVVEGNYKEYYNPTVSGEKGEDVREGEEAKSSEALVIIYINGVYQRLHRIRSTADTYCQYLKDNVYVDNNCPIVIGSEGCDIDLYSVKLYEKPLVSRDIVFNYGFDTPRFEDRIAIISRNNIWTDKEDEKSKLHDIVRGSLETHLPNLPIFSFKMHESNKDVLPVDKKNWKFLTESKYFNHNIQEGSEDTGNISFFVNSAALRNQGTSSMNYPMPWRNWDWKTDIDVAVESGAIPKDDPILSGLTKDFRNYNYHSTLIGEKWRQYDNMPKGIRKFTFKKDYASSEMCNNAVCSALFTDMAIIAGPKFPGVLQPTGSLNKYGHRLSLIATPCFMFQELTGENEGKTKTLGMMNLIPNKNETDYLGLGDVKERKWDLLKILEIKEDDLYTGDSKVPRAQAWEVSENHVIWDKKYESYSIKDAMAYPDKYEDIICYLYETVEVNFDNLFNEDNEDLAKQTLNNTISAIRDQLLISGKDSSDDGLLAFEYYIVNDQNDKQVFIKVSDKNADDKWKEGYVFEPKIESFGTYINSILNNYEARYPKDSSAVELGPNEDINVWGKGKEADFGFAPDSDWMFSDAAVNIDDSVSITQADVIKAETRDILRFHNWLVDCHPAKCVEGATITIDNNGTIETVEDNPTNRLAKFKAEANNYLILDQWILYYVWRELFWMFDSGSKNLQIYTIDGIKWGCMVRDADTALGIDNLGVETFPPYLEDTDFYTSVDGIEFFFDKAAGKYSIGQLDNSRAKGVLNGQFGSIWLNLRDSYKSQIRAMAQYLLSDSGNRLTAKGVINEFDSHQDKWSESLYNFGMRQYFGGELFYKWISSGNGNKRLSRKDWLTKAFDYRLGKYKCYPNDAGYNINWRATKLEVDDVTTKENFEFKFYQPCYILSGGSSSGIHKTSPDCYKRITAFGDEITTIPVKGWGYPADGGGTSESNTYFYGAHNITDFGPLYMTIELHDFNANGALPKVTKLQFGDKEWSKENGVYYGLDKQLQVSSMSKLQYLDITNHHALTDIDIKGCSQLEELYMSGTDILTDIVLPKTKTLNTIHFGKLIRVLNLNDLVGIKHVEFDGYSNLYEFYAKNCSDYIKKKSYEIVMSSPNLAKGELDVDWGTLEEPIKYSDLINIIVVKNIKLKGTVYIENLSFNEKLHLMDVLKQDNIDTIHPSVGLKVIVKKFIKLNGITIYPKNSYAGIINNEYTFTCSPDIDTANNVKETIWSIEDGNALGGSTNKDLFRVINNAGNLVVKRTGKVYDEVADDEYESNKPSVTIKVTVKCYTNNDKTTTYDVEDTATVYLYERSAKVGDLVYHDGSISSLAALDRNKTVIGVCFYVEELSAEDKASGKKPLRLMCALEEFNNISDTDLNNTTIYYTTWGIGSTSQIELLDNSLLDIINISQLKNYGENNALPSNVTRWDQLREGDSWLQDPGYALPNGTNNYAFGELGYKTLTENDLSIFENLSNGEKDEYSVNDKIPFGKFNTLAIINTRNQVLDNPAFNDFVDKPYVYSKDGEEKTLEYEILKTMFDNILDTQYIIDNNYLLNIFYPCASYCYGYTPYKQLKTNHVLDERFKTHKWWLPSFGELIRLGYFMNALYNSTEENRELNIFGPIIDKVTEDKNNPDIPDSKKLKFATPTDSYNYASSTEASSENVWLLDIYNSSESQNIIKNAFTKDYKNPRAIRPICMF